MVFTCGAVLLIVVFGVECSIDAAPANSKLQTNAKPKRALFSNFRRAAFAFVRPCPQHFPKKLSITQWCFVTCGTSQARTNLRSNVKWG